MNHIYQSLLKYKDPNLRVEDLNNGGIHNFSLPVLNSYFHLDETQPILLRGDILVISSHQGRFKSWCFFPLTETEENKTILNLLRQLGPAYSMFPIPWLTAEETLFREIQYNIEEVLDPKSYLNKKKRYQRLTYPFKQLEKFGVVRRQIATEKEIKALHNEWVEHKLADPDTYKIMFPSQRYIYCYRKAITAPSKYITYTFYMENRLIVVRVIGIQNQQAFDLANFGRTWDIPSNMMEYLEIYAFRDLSVQGFKTLNCGAALNKNLAAFKTHYPHTEVWHYAYSKKKEQTTAQRELF